MAPSSRNHSHADQAGATRKIGTLPSSLLAYNPRAVMKRKSSVAMIGLDGADHLLIEHWSAQGYLPGFARLLREGTYGLLESTATVLSGTPWLSIASGCNPAKCGVYERHQLKSGTCRGPGRAKMTSTITVPASSVPNCPPTRVMTGIMAFLRACL